MSQMPPQNPSVPPPPPEPFYPPPIRSTKGKGQAVASLVLGILAFTPFLGVICGIIAIILGAIAQGKKTSAKGMATAGIILGGVGIFVSLTLGVSILVPILGGVREKARQAVCMSNANGIGKALAVYQLQNYEPAPDLQVLVKANLIGPTMFHCMSNSQGGRDSMDYIYVPPSPNADAKTIIVTEVRQFHPDGRVVLYVNGGVDLLKPPQFDMAMRNPRNKAMADALRKSGGLP